MELFKILGICFIAAVLAVIIKQYKGEYALIITLVAAGIVIVAAVRAIAAPVAALAQKLEDCGVNGEYFTVALKGLGIAYITGFIADACRDSGQTSLAAKAELAGKCAIFLLSMPQLFSVLETALGFVS